MFRCLIVVDSDLIFWAEKFKVIATVWFRIYDLRFRVLVLGFGNKDVIRVSEELRLCAVQGLLCSVRVVKCFESLCSVVIRVNQTNCCVWFYGQVLRFRG